MTTESKPVQYRAILLGSPDFSECRLPSPSSLRASARGIRNYLQTVLQLEEDYELLSLFGSEESPGAQLNAISDFLKQVSEEVAEDENLVLLVYYVGHGYIAKTNNAYCLAIKSTSPEFSLSDGIITKELLNRLKTGAPKKKRVMFIDACFAAKAAGDAITLSDQESMALSEINEIPDPWTAIYCAVKGDTLALAPKGSKYTLFSHGVIHALNSGDGTSRSISIESLDILAWSEIKRKFADLATIPRPHLHFPDQPLVGKTEPIFPIASYAVDEDLLRAVKLTLENELADFVDIVRESIRPEIEEAILSSMNQKIATLRSEKERELLTISQNNSANLEAFRGELTASMADSVRIAVARQFAEALKSETRSFGEGVSSTLSTMIATKPDSSTKSRPKTKLSNNDTDRGSRLGGFFFSRLYDGDSRIDVENLVSRQNIGFIALLLVSIGLAAYAILPLSFLNGWSVILSLWFDNLPNAHLSSERLFLAKFMLGTVIVAFVECVFWVVVGVMGHRRTTTNRRYDAYFFFRFAVNPSAAIAMLFVSTLIFVVMTPVASLTISRFSSDTAGIPLNVRPTAQ
jgi:hypothetical protein